MRVTLAGAGVVMIGLLLLAPRADTALQAQVTGAATTRLEHQAAAPGEAPHAEASHEEGGLLEVIARVINFGVLAGLVVYVARSPVMAYLSQRRDQLRGDLVQAAHMRKTANEQMVEIDRRLTALPEELEALKAQGVREIAAEEARIATAAELERERLTEQAQREIDLQVRVARDDLRRRAAELATTVARGRIADRMTPSYQDRLMDRYVRQLPRSERRS